MAATYTPVSLGEMQAVLKAEKGWFPASVPANVEEHVFDWTVKPHNAVVRVYTSIRKDTGMSRSCGADAIRVCAVNLTTDKGLVKTTRVHRVPGWDKRLQARILTVLKTARARLSASAPAAAPASGPAKPKFDNPVPVDVATFPFPALKFKKDRLAWLRERLAEAPWALWALGEIAARQTDQEYAAGATIVDNGIGFSGVDGDLLTSFHKQFAERGWLSPKQSKLLLAKMPKYAGQCLSILEALNVAWAQPEPEPPAPQPSKTNTLFDSPSPDAGAASESAPASPSPADPAAKQNPDDVVEPKCHRCQGSGRYVVPGHHGGYRDLGPCFTCDGKGFVTRSDMWRNAAYWSHRAASEIQADLHAADDERHGPQCDCSECLEDRAVADYEHRMYGRD